MGIILFVFGTAIGSFINNVIDRFATNRSIIKGRSYCEKCKKNLAWHDLVPLVSFLLLKGKCRYCSVRIKPRILLVEILGGLTVLGLYLYTLSIMFSPALLVLLGVIVFIFISIFFIDLEYGIIPDKLIILLLVSAIMYLGISQGFQLNNIIAALSAFLFFLFLFLATKGRGMGFGDVKLSFALGFLLGFPGIVVALYIAFLTGAVVSIILILWRKKTFRKSTIPFGPFLVLGAITTLFWGETIILPIVKFLF